jgi:DNA-binding LacI/PurR family transcriptional regulator
MADQPSLPTLRDVADLAGVSPTTASMALSGRTGTAHISPASIKRVQIAAKRLGYRGNYHARTLSSGRSYTLGLAVGSGPVSVLQHDFFNHLCGGVESAARARGFDLLLIGGTDAFEPLERALHHLEARRIDALIVFRHLHPGISADLAHCHLPLVILEGRDLPQLPGVLFDPAPGIAEAVAHLVGLGHRRLLWIAIDKDLNSSMSAPRYQAFLAAVSAQGVASEELVVTLPATTEQDPRSFTALLYEALSAVTLPPSCTAVICFNDEMALALIALLAKRGISVPEDLSVIGFDDRFGTYAIPALTSISHELRALGMSCVSLALDIVENRVPREPVPLIRVPAHLVVRHSTGPVRD